VCMYVCVCVCVCVCMCYVCVCLCVCDRGDRVHFFLKQKNTNGSSVHYVHICVY
jgi:hypothetical protein